jgi:hypothetical protein
VQFQLVALESDERELADNFSSVHIEAAQHAECGTQVPMLYDWAIHRFAFIGDKNNRCA